MKKSQILILWLGILVIIAMLLFPPWRYVDKFDMGSTYGVIRTVSTGPYRLIFLGAPTEFAPKGNPEIDKTRLLIPILVVLIITTGLIVTLNRKGQKPE